MHSPTTKRFLICKGPSQTMLTNNFEHVENRAARVVCDSSGVTKRKSSPRLIPCSLLLRYFSVLTRNKLVFVILLKLICVTLTCVLLRSSRIIHIFMS